MCEGLRLQQKQISPVFLYDALGSKLFSAICALPWYSIRRAELALLSENANEIAASLRGPVRVIELGPGNGEKIEAVIKALEHRQPRVEVDFVDVSADALQEAMHRFTHSRKVFARYHIGVFEECLDAALAGPAMERRLVAFLGSNLGNFAASAAEEFLLEIRHRLRPGDGILLGVDLVKPVDELLRAYDDPVGVTAAFNKNLLARINAVFGGNFDLAAFRHEARWEPVEKRVEMHLVSVRRQRVFLPGLDLDVAFEEGESIWTEASHKYTPDDVDALMQGAGLQRKDRWIDPHAGFMNAVYWLPPLSLVE